MTTLNASSLSSICYLPIQKGVGLNVGSPTKFVERIERAFGAFPMRLTMAHCAALIAMSAMLDGDCDPYDDLVEAIRKFGEVEIYANEDEDRGVVTTAPQRPEARAS